jgi:hypothetical protein
MDVQAHEALWPPHVGDYARVRDDGTLGEVIEIICRGEQRSYILALFTTKSDARLVYNLEELEPVWRSWPERAPALWHDEDAPVKWVSSWPSWTR